MDQSVGPLGTGELGPLANAAATEFLGRIALVTGGAGAAIGSATCRMLAARGAAVVVLDENERRTDATVRTLTEEFGTRAYPMVADVADRQAIDDGLARVEAELGPIDMASTSSSSASTHCRRVVPSLPTHRRWHSGNPPNTLEGAPNISGHLPSLLVHASSTLNRKSGRIPRSASRVSLGLRSWANRLR